MPMLLLVEDQDSDAKYVQSLLPADYSVVRARSLKEAMGLLDTVGDELHLVLLDLTLPDSSAANTFVPMCERDLDIPVIILTGIVSDSLVTRAIQSGIDDYLQKDDLTKQSLLTAINKALTRKKKELRLRVMTKQQLTVLQELAETTFVVWLDTSRQQLQLIDRVRQGDMDIMEIADEQNKLLEYLTRVLTELHDALSPKISDLDRGVLLRKVLASMDGQGVES